MHLHVQTECATNTAHIISSHHIVDVKRQNRLKVGTAKSRCSQYQMMMSGKDFLKSHVLSWQLKVYSDWEMLHPLAGRSRSLGQQPGKHVLAQARSRVRRCTSMNNSAQVCHSVKSMKLIINSKLFARLLQDHVQYLFHSSNYRGSIGSAFTEFRDFTQTKT